MYVHEIMSTDLITVDMDENLRKVKNIFDRHEFHHLLVTENKELYGVISDRDYLKSVSPYIDTPSETLHDSLTLNKKAHQIMSRKPIALKPDAHIIEAIKLFNRHNISGLPVVDNHFYPIGIITWRDILKAIELTPNALLADY